MRLFIAIAIPNEIRSALASFVTEMQKTTPKAKWVRPENLHVTLKFLGETEGSKVSQIESKLSEVRSPEPVLLNFCGLGFFPTEKRARVLWVGMESSANLSFLAKDIDLSLHQLGFSLEERPFTPHLTLARFNPPQHWPNLASAVEQATSRAFGSLATREFHLIESKLKSTGAEYTTLKSFAFTTET